MGPKKYISTRQQSMSLDDPIETDEWHFAIGLVVEKKPEDHSILSQFPKAAFCGVRPEIKSIDYRSDVVKIIEQFVNGEIDYKYNRLLAFSSVFEDAVKIKRKGDDIPAFHLVRIVKALILLLKEEVITQKQRKRISSTDAINSMAARPAVLNGANTKAKKEIEKKVDEKGDKSLKLKPPSVGKEDTKLLKRGEGRKESELIDDAPKNSFYQLYVVLTGFYDPGFPLELIKAHVPLTTLICLDALSSVSNVVNFSVVDFWPKFLKIIWDPINVNYFKDTIFQVYVPENLPTDLNDVEKFIYNQICFLMYDLSDFKRQHINYLNHLKLWDVSEGEEKIQDVQEYQEELDSLPCEHVTVPFVLQYILDALCGEDDVREEGPHKINYLSLDSEAPSIYTKKTNLSSVTTLSDSPNLSQIFMGDVRNPIYQKFKSLDARYGLEEDEKLFFENPEDGSISTGDLSVLVKRQRLYAENLEEALRGGVKQNFITSCWKNQEEACGSCKYGEVKFPPVIMDYSLYLLWIQRVICLYEKEKEELNYFVKGSSERRYTVTEFTRMKYNEHRQGYFSAPELKILSLDALKSVSKIMIQPFISDLNIPEKYLKDEMKVYEDIRAFLGEDIFSNSNGFEFVEEFSKKEMEDLTEEIVLDYNCVDCCRSALTDSVFLVCHRRQGDDGAQREGYNVSLKTPVGLRDFYDYVIDDEKDWITESEECYRKTLKKSEASVSKKSELGEFLCFTDADFVSENSLKSQKIFEESLKSSVEIRKESLKVEEEEVVQCEVEKIFSGYDVSPVGVQYSGLNSFFSAADNCSVEVGLQERLYGEQELKIKIRQGGHVLYLYSYVCPKPHISDQHTCHILHKSGMVIAFTRRTIETFREVEEFEPVLPSVKSKNKKLSQEKSQIVIKKIPIIIKDDNFYYDMKLSLPSGLTVEVVKTTGKPFYVKQKYVVRPDCYSNTVRTERSRLFLSNGDLVKMLTDDTFVVLRGDATVINSSLKPEIGAFYDRTMPNGDFFRIISGELETAKKFHLFENLDIETSTSYFRRGDGTNYSLHPDGTFSVYFKDGTRISTSVSDECDVEWSDDVEYCGENEFESDCSSVRSENFVLVHVKRIFEHPDYATVVYDTCSNEWTVKLPFDSEIKATPKGCYSARLDEFTCFRMNPGSVFMNRRRNETFVETSADLTVFETEGKIYCETTDSNRRTFVVESTGHCYVETGNEGGNDGENEFEDKFERELPKGEGSSSCCRSDPEAGSYSNSFLTSECSVSRNSSSVRSSQFPRTSNPETERGSAENNESSRSQGTSDPKTTRKLSKENRYFIIRRDKSGFELVHKENSFKILSNLSEDTILFCQNLPGPENKRFFVLLDPYVKRKKWEVKSLIPDFDYSSNNRRKKIPSTYGIPPSWMHPFYEKKTKINIPDRLTARVLIELKRTDFRKARNPKFKDSLIDEEYKEIKFEDGFKNVQKIMRKIAADDQDLLRDLFLSAVASEIEVVNSFRPTNSEKLKNYLEMSEYYNKLKDFHKSSIKNHVIPNYFHHPAGLCWLILQDIIDSIKEGTPGKHSKTSTPEQEESDVKIISSETVYNLEFPPQKNFSELTYRSNVSVKSAPAALENFKGSLCKGEDFYASKSEPAYKYEDSCHEVTEKRESVFSKRESKDLEKEPSVDCAFTGTDLELLSNLDGSC